MDLADLTNGNHHFVLRDEAHSHDRYVTFFEHLGLAQKSSVTAGELVHSTNQYTFNMGIGIIALSPENTTTIMDLSNLIPSLVFQVTFHTAPSP